MSFSVGNKAAWAMVASSLAELLLAWDDFSPLLRSMTSWTHSSRVSVLPKALWPERIIISSRAGSMRMPVT